MGVGINTGHFFLPQSLALDGFGEVQCSHLQNLCCVVPMSQEN